MDHTVEVTQTKKWEEREKQNSWTDGRTPEQLAMVEAVKASGLLGAFDQAARAAKPHAVPKSMESFFLAWLRTAMPKRVPAFVLSHFSSQFIGQLEFYASQQIVGVTVAKRLVAFVPSALVVGTPSTKDGFGTTADVRGFDHWVSTRFGYVPAGATHFMEAMRRRSIGEFARPSLVS